MKKVLLLTVLFTFGAASLASATPVQHPGSKRYLKTKRGQMLRAKRAQMLRAKRAQMLRAERAQMLRAERARMLRAKRARMLRAKRAQMLRARRIARMKRARKHGAVVRLHNYSRRTKIVQVRVGSSRICSWNTFRGTRILRPGAALNLRVSRGSLLCYRVITPQAVQPFGFRRWKKKRIWSPGVYHVSVKSPRLPWWKRKLAVGFRYKRSTL